MLPLREVSAGGKHLEALHLLGEAVHGVAQPALRLFLGLGNRVHTFVLACQRCFSEGLQLGLLLTFLEVLLRSGMTMLYSASLQWYSSSPLHAHQSQALQ